MTSRSSPFYPLRWLAALLLLGHGMAATAQGGPAHFPLTSALIVATLGQAGLSVGAEQVRLPMALNTASEHPTLRLTAAELLPTGLLRLRLACSLPGDCLPFLATVDLPNADERSSTLSLLRSRIAVAPTNPEMPLLRVGAHTTLLLETAHMRIALPVIALDAGRIGAAVRVSSPDRKQTFRGTVDPAGTVRGDLP